MRNIQPFLNIRGAYYFCTPQSIIQRVVHRAAFEDQCDSAPILTNSKCSQFSDITRVDACPNHDCPWQYVLVHLLVQIFHCCWKNCTLRCQDFSNQAILSIKLVYRQLGDCGLCVHAPCHLAHAKSLAAILRQYLLANN